MDDTHDLRVVETPTDLGHGHDAADGRSREGRVRLGDVGNSEAAALDAGALADHERCAGKLAGGDGALDNGRKIAGVHGARKASSRDAAGGLRVCGLSQSTIRKTNDSSTVHMLARVHCHCM